MRKFGHSTAGFKERHATDRYETPSSVTQVLVDRFVFPAVVHEPACGTGRIVRALYDNRIHAIGTDLLEDNLDFLSDEYVQRFPNIKGIIANPPYQGGLAEAFVRRALDLTDGPVAMLLKSTFMYGQKRAAGLYAVTPPSHILMIPVRIKFYYADGTRLKGQAYDHQWMVWRGEPKDPDQPMVDWPHPDEFYDAK